LELLPCSLSSSRLFCPPAIASVLFQMTGIREWRPLRLRIPNRKNNSRNENVCVGYVISASGNLLVVPTETVKAEYDMTKASQYA
jgi:hypothetical protein